MKTVRSNEFFKNTCIKDVTENYDFIHAQNIIISLPQSRPNKKFAYLTVFDPNGWSLVDWAEVEFYNAETDSLVNGEVIGTEYK